MKKFLVLYKAPIEEMQKMGTATPEQQKAGMAGWMEWMATHKADLVDGGAPVGKTKVISNEGVTDTKNDVGGYSITQAESHDEAMKIFVGSPHLSHMNGATVEVMEIKEMPGM